MLQSYIQYFSIDMDQEWEKHAVANSDAMTRDEAKKFVTNIAQYASEERGKFYDQNNFDQIFDELDDQGRGYLSRNEMALLVKKAFKDPNASLTPRNMNTDDTPPKSAPSID